MNNIILAFCSDNTELADQLAVKLSRAGIAFNQICDQPGDQPGQFASRVQSTDEPVLLIVTDNYLRNLNCMADGLSMLQSLLRHHRATVVIANGVDTKGNPTPTLIERNVDALQYIHFWQDKYQNMLDQRANVPPHEREAFEQDLGVMQELAQNIGEFISGLRDSFYFTWPQLIANHFTLFFQQFNLSHLHEAYKMVAKLDEDVPPIRSATTSEKVAETPMYTGFSHAAAATSAETVHTAPEPAVDAPKQTESLGAPEPEPAVIEQMVGDAWFWIEQGQTDRGLQLFELAIEQNPGNEYLRNGYLGALAKYTRVAKPDVVEQPAPQAPVIDIPESKKYDQMGEEALQKGDFLFAKYCWDRVAELSSDYPGIYAKLGILTSEHLKDYKETAIHYLRLALQHDAHNADLHYRLATLLRDHQGKFEEALQHLQQAVGLAPTNAGAWFDLAYASLQMGRNGEAQNQYQRAIDLSPELRTEAYDQLFQSAQTAEPAAKTPVAGPEPAPEPPAEVVAEAAPSVRPVNRREPLTVFITGATSGIGRATAEVFAREGHRLILTGRRAERLEEISRHLTDHYGAEVLTLAFDVTNLESVKNHLENLPENWQDIDMLINNAGGAKGLAPIHEGRIDHWETMIDANLKGLLYVTRLVSPGMVKRRKGHILNICSTAGKEAYPNGNVYCATKFAVDGLTRAMRMDLYAHNVRVSQVSPGHVEETEFALTRFDGDVERAKIYNDFQPLKSGDVAEVIYFIATRPAHVNIQDVLMMGTQQASSMLIDRSGR